MAKFFFMTFLSKFIKFGFCKILSVKVSSSHFYSFYRTKSCCTSLKREFSPLFNEVQYDYVACLVLTLEAETLEDVFLEHPLSNIFEDLQIK